MDITHAEHSRRIDILLGLSDTDIADRRKSIGASDANIILSGDDEKIMKLWRFKIGLDEAEDLSDVLPVQMGIWTEDLNLRWYEKQTGNRVYDRKRKVTHDDYPWLTATLDGMTVLIGNQRAVIDAKHVGPFNYDLDTIVARYTPQLVVQMTLTSCDYGVLSVFSGNSKWEQREIQLDPLYQARVIAACRKFWGHCVDRTPPCDMPVFEAPQAGEPTRKVSMIDSNAWCSWEAEYLQFEESASRHDAAAKELRGLVEPDVKEATGKFLVARRDKRGALRFYKKKG